MSHLLTDYCCIKNRSISNRFTSVCSHHRCAAEEAAGSWKHKKGWRHVDTMCSAYYCSNPRPSSYLHSGEILKAKSAMLRFSNGILEYCDPICHDFAVFKKNRGRIIKRNALEWEKLVSNSRNMQKPSGHVDLQ